MQFELTRYLSDNWVPVIEKDVDGPSSLPLRMDSEVPNLGKFSACRRVARTIYMGSAPLTQAAHRGLEDRRVKLGCVMPGESPAVFGDALRRLAGAATYLYQDGPRYWYSTQPTVTKLAEDRAEQLKRDPDKVVHELEQRLRSRPATGRVTSVASIRCRSRGRMYPTTWMRAWSCCGSITPTAKSRAARLRLPPKRFSNRAATRHGCIATRSSFSPPTRTACRISTRRPANILAWESILAEQGAAGSCAAPGEAGRDPEGRRRWNGDSAYSGDLPVAAGPRAGDAAVPVTWQALRLTEQDALAVRASKKLRSDELLLTSFAATRLRMELDRIPLWRGDHVSMKQLVEDFARYLYLPRLKESSVLVGAICAGVSLLTWEYDGFAFADSYDDAAGRYRGLRGGQLVALADADSPALLVKSDIARKQLDGESTGPPGGGVPGGTTGGGDGITPPGTGPVPPLLPPKATLPKRFHGTVTLDAGSCWPRRQPHCRRSDCASRGLGRCQGEGDTGGGG